MILRVHHKNLHLVNNPQKRSFLNTGVILNEIVSNTCLYLSNNNSGLYTSCTSIRKHNVFFHAYSETNSSFCPSRKNIEKFKLNNFLQKTSNLKKHIKTTLLSEILKEICVIPTSTNLNRS